MKISKPAFEIRSLEQMAFQTLKLRLSEKNLQKVIERCPFIFEKLNDKANCFNKMCKTIQKTLQSVSGAIFGGYIRDLFEQVDPTDIDVRFQSNGQLESFIAKICEMFNVVFFEKVRRVYLGNGDVNIKVITIVVIHKDHPDVYIPMDLTIESDWKGKHGDFDVNDLTMIGKHIWCSSRSEHDKEVLRRRIMAKVLTPLDANGEAEPHHVRFNQCISRKTRVGKKMLYRIRKMENRGWEINGKDCCSNPECILAPETAWKIYDAKEKTDLLIRLEKRRLFNEENRRLRRFMKSLQEIPDFKEYRRRQIWKKHHAKLRKEKRMRKFSS